MSGALDRRKDSTRSASRISKYSTSNSACKSGLHPKIEAIGSKPKPETVAPRRLSHLASHWPLKPVNPEMRTFLL